ncbi:hypothetical protein FN846DRAFT_912194 [Sphaerosporella brunnea]|uniref:Uncharacterized protein n=1 Tax=Sphaerosporella brunnea TaxID=1250544 RepID=A0A5J5EI06_9PEZI|nr:hypothetical protein FN846DRAFT_912194 [Sphaerosporella brunnea]
MSDPRLQSSLNSYSVAVQRYTLLTALLPPSLRPPMLERFQHRNNRWAVDRQTANVRKVIARMEEQLKRAQPDIAAPSAAPDAAGNRLDGPLQDVQASASAAEFPDNSGQQHPTMPSTHNDQGSVVEKKERPPQEDLASRPGPTAGRDPVVMALEDAGLSPDGHLIRPHSTDTDKVSSGTGCEPRTFSPADELDAIVRVGVVSPDAAIRLSGLIDTLRSDGASYSVVKKVCTAFLASVQDGTPADRASG